MHRKRNGQTYLDILNGKEARLLDRWVLEAGYVQVARVAAILTNPDPGDRRPIPNDFWSVVEMAKILDAEPAIRPEEAADRVAARVVAENDWNGRPRVSVGTLKNKLLRDYRKAPRAFSQAAAKMHRTKARSFGEDATDAAESRALWRLIELDEDLLRFTEGVGAIWPGQAAIRRDITIGNFLKEVSRTTITQVAHGALRMNKEKLGTAAQREIADSLRRLGWRQGARTGSARWWVRDSFK